MSKTTERDVEKLLRGESISNSAHKEALRTRLFSGPAKLGDDDLASVTGGLTGEVTAEKVISGHDEGDVERELYHCQQLKRVPVRLVPLTAPTARAGKSLSC